MTRDECRELTAQAWEQYKQYLWGPGTPNASLRRRMALVFGALTHLRDNWEEVPNPEHRADVLAEESKQIQIDLLLGGDTHDDDPRGI